MPSRHRLHIIVVPSYPIRDSIYSRGGAHGRLIGERARYKCTLELPPLAAFDYIIPISLKICTISRGIL